MLKIRRALISVWDKKGISELAKKLANLHVEIISTGKTAALLRKSGIKVKETSSLTSFPEILSGRVKTMHPKIFGGILANKKHPLHMEEIKNLGIQPIDMVVVNLYPFPEKLKERLGIDEMIEYIDIGGSTMIRAAAKNFKNVACLSMPEQYKQVADELTKNNGFLSQDTLKTLAQQAFCVSKEYDSCIYDYFIGKEMLHLDMAKTKSLRYGENPHQKGDLYNLAGKDGIQFRQLQGKELSFNNFLDLDNAMSMVKEFSEPAAAIVKHASPCGVGIDKKLSSAYRKAFEADPISSFGGVIALNRKVDRETARQVIKSEFKECIIAPSFSKEAMKLFSAKKNFRVIESNFIQKANNTRCVRSTQFGYLLQDKDLACFDKHTLRVVTKRKPTQREMKDLAFAWKIVKHVKSNAITIAKNSNLLGVGAGQPSRVGAVKIALDKAVGSVRGAVLASDAFFPKDDAISLAHRKGIKAIIQPGGSIKDNDIIKMCDKLGVSMVFTGIRHLSH